jgi:hypothetical protein
MKIVAFLKISEECSTLLISHFKLSFALTLNLTFAPHARAGDKQGLPMNVLARSVLFTIGIVSIMAAFVKHCNVLEFDPL